MIKTYLLLLCYCFFYCPQIMAGGPGGHPPPSSIASGSTQGLSSIASSIDPEKLDKLHKEANEGNVESIYSLGIYYQVNGKIDTAIQYLDQGAKLGHYKCQHALGKYYYENKDYEKAAPLFLEAAKPRKIDEDSSQYNQGDDSSQYNYGLCCYKGRGVPQDYGQAIYWFMQAAKQGYDLAIQALEQTQIPPEVLKEPESHTDLSLAGKVVKPESIPILALVLPYITELTSLDLSGMGLGDKGIEDLTYALTQLPNLTALNLSKNNIGEDKQATLTKLLPAVQT